MKEIKYELNEFDKATIKCNYYPQIMVGSVKCIVCAFNNGKNKKDNIVYCNFDESFLGHCLAALNWQRGTEADILAVLERVMEVKSYPACVANNANFRNRILTIIQEPTDA